MNEHDMEDQLRKATLPSLPKEWKDDILSRALDSQPSAECRPSLWRELLWPSPKAWGALAGAWILVGLLCGIHVRQHHASGAIAGNRPDPAVLRHTLEQRRELLVELTGVSQPDPPDREPSPFDGPRTEIRAEEVRT